MVAVICGSHGTVEVAAKKGAIIAFEVVGFGRQTEGPNLSG
jgi:hypothetical protein